MLPFTMLLAVFITMNIICCHTQPICPVSTGEIIDSLLLDTSCFAVDMTLNVDNILADPSYISRDANFEVIKNALTKTLSDNHMTGFSITNDISSMNENWSIDKQQCPDNIDINNVNTFNFETTSYNMLCTDNALNIDENSQTIECQFIMPQSIVYIWNIESIESLINIDNINECDTANLEAIIGEKDILKNEWKVLGRSNILTINTANSKLIQKFVFDTNQMILSQGTIYSLIINVKNCISPISVVSNPMLLTRQEPSACKLGKILAMDDAMMFGLDVLCNKNNTDNGIRKHFENILYEQHSSQTVMNDLLSLRRRLDSLGWGSTTGGSPRSWSSVLFRRSLHASLSDGTSYTVAEDAIFPDYGQCIALDDITRRVFAVGGQINGAAINRLSIYKINSLGNVDIISTELILDKPRFGTMCFYYKSIQNGREYIIVMNGMNHINNINNNDNWYKDIVFIPLDATENANVNQYGNFPKIKLKYNVIDMRPYISATNMLYLFGGRDGENAINYIQMIDLNEIFNAYDPSSMILNNHIFTTMDRMKGMALNAVIPFSDFVRIHNKTCIMILGGQNYINHHWIDIDIPLNTLQLYCNPIMNDQMIVPSEIVEFTEFDKQNLHKIDNVEVKNNVNNVFMTEYDFRNNNDMLYEFDISLKICFDIDHSEYLMNTLNLFNNEELKNQLNGILIENMLDESREKYKGWNNGFGKVLISNINAISTINDCIYQSNHPSNCKQEVLPNGDQKCGYNALNGDCYLIGRKAEINNINKNDDFDVESINKQNKTNTYLNIVTDILCAILFVLLLILCIGISYFRHKNKNKKNGRIRIYTDVDIETELGEINKMNRCSAVNGLHDDK